MSEGKHTPGPWHFTEGGSQKKGDYYAHIGAETSMTILASMNEHHPAAGANARLIAAAPEMLEALVTALPYIEAAEEEEAYKPGAVAKVTKQVRAAIARATGEQP